MKLIREYINEKFDETSDPIHDMGIGSWPVKIQKLYEKYFSKYGKIDMLVEGDVNQYPTIFIYIPYKSMYEKHEMKNSLESSRHASEIAEDILQPIRKDLWSIRIYPSSSFRNRSKFHKKDRGYIVQIITTNFNSDDPEAEF